MMQLLVYIYVYIFMLIFFTLNDLNNNKSYNRYSKKGWKRNLVMHLLHRYIVAFYNVFHAGTNKCQPTDAVFMKGANILHQHPLTHSTFHVKKEDFLGSSSTISSFCLNPLRKFRKERRNNLCFILSLACSWHEVYGRRIHSLLYIAASN